MVGVYGSPSYSIRCHRVVCSLKRMGSDTSQISLAGFVHDFIDPVTKAISDSKEGTTNDIAIPYPLTRSQNKAEKVSRGFCSSYKLVCFGF